MPLLQIALMLKLNEFQVGSEGIRQRVREHGNPHKHNDANRRKPKLVETSNSSGGS